MKTTSCLLLLIGILSTCLAQQTLQKMHGVNYSEIVINDAFWTPKIKKVAVEAIDVCIYQTEIATPRIRNFEKVANGEEGSHEGIYYDDSDVYKAIEAMAYTLHSVPNPNVEAKADEWIHKIAAAQQEDGYLNTYYTLQGLEGRWQDMEKHEAYCAGHLIEAAIAYYHATGKRKLLDVAIRLADHMDMALREAGRHWVAGHQEVELALVKLYRTTGDEKYLQLSEWFLDQRGHGYGKGKIWDTWNDPAYCQDALPVKQQTEITGHAVRAMYMYTGIADLASITGDKDYLTTMLKVWEDVVHRNTYITGGIGSAGTNEGFSIDYDLPNEHAYCETCASVGMVFWNQRMNWLTGEGMYIDVLERSLYNSALDGISVDGRQFFYPNPLASHGQHQRKDWFGTACCPSNISRLIASVGNYIYSKNGNALWVNLFIGSETTQMLGGEEVTIRIEDSYTWEGKVKMALEMEDKAHFDLYLRVPGWSTGQALPGDLYTFAAIPARPILTVDGAERHFDIRNGYIKIVGPWKNGQEISLTLDMTPQLLLSKREVEANADRAALQRGPLVYCFEAADNPGKVFNALLPLHTRFEETTLNIQGEEVVGLQGNLPILRPTRDGLSVESISQKMIAIPYYSWCNRGSNDMQVWMPEKVLGIEIK